MEERIADLESDLLEAKSRIADYELKIKSLMHAISARDFEIEELKRQYGEDRERLCAESDNAKAFCLEAEDTICDLRQVNEEMRHRIEELEADVKSAKDRADKCESHPDVLAAKEKARAEGLRLRSIELDAEMKKIKAELAKGK